MPVTHVIREEALGDEDQRPPVLSGLTISTRALVLQIHIVRGIVSVGVGTSVGVGVVLLGPLGVIDTVHHPHDVLEGSRTEVLKVEEGRKRYVDRKERKLYRDLTAMGHSPDPEGSTFVRVPRRADEDVAPGL